MEKTNQIDGTLYEDINVSELTADAELENIINKSDMSLGADKKQLQKEEKI